MGYFIVVLLQTVVLPIVSGVIELAVVGGDPVLVFGKWFVFWAVGARLMLAGIRQYFQPSFTSRDIMGIETPEVHILVRELGGANIAFGTLGLASIALPDFVLPAAIAAGIFYTVAGIEHVRSDHRGRNESIAMISDFFAAAILIGFAILWLIPAK